MEDSKLKIPDANDAYQQSIASEKETIRLIESTIPNEILENTKHGMTSLDIRSEQFKMLTSEFKEELLEKGYRIERTYDDYGISTDYRIVWSPKKEGFMSRLFSNLRAKFVVKK